MPATVAPRDFWDKWHGEPHVVPPVDAPSRAIDPANARRVRRPPSLGRRVARGFGRFVITIGLGVGGTLAWQTYGDTAREMIVAAYPQLDWIAPQSAAPDPAAPAAPATVGSAAPIA